MASVPKTERARTEAEYLELERKSEERHEYLDGEIFLMAGESPSHGDVCTNFVMVIGSQLKGRPCRVWSKDRKVRSGPVPQSGSSRKGLYSFPDLIVVCGEPQFLDDHQDVLLNPRVIIEVLSPTTEAFDRSEKFLRYRTHLESLTDYLVVSQTRPRIEHFERQSNGQWVIATTATEISETVELSSIGCTLRLSEVYDRIVFSELSDQQEGSADA